MTLADIFDLYHSRRIRHEYGNPDKWIASDGTEFPCTPETYLKKLVQCAEYENDR